ncbi:MAG: hypothetical protein V4678_04325 [Patescibacteria group bacterium]
MKETMSRRDAAHHTTKALIADVKSNVTLMKFAVNEANKVEQNQVNPDDVDTEMAFGLWAFSYNLVWLDINVQDELLRDDLIDLSLEEYTKLTGIPIEIARNWVERMRAGRRLTHERGKVGFMTLPVMFYLGYGSLESLKLDLLLSYAATLYSEYVSSVTGHWKKAFEFYDIS